MFGWSQWSVVWPLLATRSRSIPDQSHSVTRNEPHMVTRRCLLLSKWGLSLTRLASGPRIMVAYNWRGRGQELKLIAKLAPPTKNCPQWPKYWPWWPKKYLWSPKPTSFLGSFFLIWGNPLHLSNKCPLNYESYYIDTHNTISEEDVVTEGLNQLPANQQLMLNMKPTFMCFLLILLLFYEIAFDLTAILEISPYIHALIVVTLENSRLKEMRSCFFWN